LELPDILEIVEVFGKPQYLKIEYENGHIFETGKQERIKV